MKKRAHVLGVLMVWACLSTAARADSITLTIPNPYPTFVGPQTVGTTTVPFFGTVSAPATNTGLYYITGLDQSVDRYQLVTTPLFNSLSSGLAPGQSITGELFDLTVMNGNFGFPLPDGTVIPFNNTFYLMGGSQPSPVMTLVPGYSVGVRHIIGPAVAPEPSTWVLAAIGLVLLVSVRLRPWEVRRHSAPAAVAS